MAATPLTGKQDKMPADKPKNAILALLGNPTFEAGDGRTYPRTTGWGANKKPHPDGGTNETIAFAIWRPFKGLQRELSGRIYCERYTENGKPKRTYSVSLPFLGKAVRGDSSGNDAVEQVKIYVRDLYRQWASSDAAKASQLTNKRMVRADTWTEDETPD
jgi:hypothetical protein